ncbi:MAG TPA: UvrB/UvrC motif-containing protein [Chitinispirillaceae bacterium]|nr:UvrB/UvrC motif-containing protein [Chitinispirillaceae bacterium]
MNMCDECGLNPANIHLTQILQNETHVFHLCDECARKKGINISIQDELISEENSAEKAPEKVCSRCGLNFSEFRNKGWLGCSDCYNSFEKEIDELLVQVHGSSVHKGKKYSGLTAGGASINGEIKRLRHELAIAIKNEEFEQAAMIRDTIHSLKKNGLE